MDLFYSKEPWLELGARSFLCRNRRTVSLQTIQRGFQHRPRRAVFCRSCRTIRRFPNLTGILYSSKAGKSSYQALQSKVEKRFSSGWNVLSAYTYSHSIDNDSGDASGTPNLNPSNFQFDRGSSAFDIRHRWITSVLYELPFGSGKRFLGSSAGWQNAVVGGWQMNVITTYSSGLSTTVASPDRSGVVFIAQRANATGINPGSNFSLNGQTLSPGQDFGGNNRGLILDQPERFRIDRTAATGHLRS